MAEEELDRITSDGGLVVINGWSGPGVNQGLAMQAEWPGYSLVGASDNEGYTADSTLIGSERFTDNTNALFVYHRDTINVPVEPPPLV